MGLLRFALKVGLASTAVYYVNQEGVWRDSSESLKLYDKINKTLQPYAADVKKQLPFEIPEIPKEITNCDLMKQSWNYGVTSTFQFVGELPSLAGKWTKCGVNSILQHPEVQKLFSDDVKEPTA